MRSNNPVFNRSPEFNGQRNAGAPYGGYQQPGMGYSDPSGWGIAQGGAPQQAPYKSSPMTIDTVVQKTAMSVGLTIVVALATYIALPPVTEEPSALATAGAVAVVGSLVAFGLSMVNSFKRVISPALVLAFAAVQGVALGGFTMVFGAFADGIIVPAVFGTFAAFAGTLAAYKVLNIQVGDKFRKFVVAAVFGMVGLSLISFVLSLFGVQTGLFGMGGLGMLTAIAGLVLGVFMLILDFDFVEQGIRAGLDERESWRAAFAMTVSLVWIYTNLLRLLAILNQD
jgi:uncharacterized YccA/Bax inhibitor family protein